MFYLIICICCLFIVWKLCSWKSTDNEPPWLPGGLPLIGHGLLLVGDSIKSYNNINWISEECLKKGGILSGKLGFRKVYYVTDPEAILTVSNSCLDKDYIYNFAKAFIGNGLITGNKEVWKRHRKLLNPAFGQQVLNSFIRNFNCQARILVNQLAFQEGKPFDHETSLRQSNLESVCYTVIGIGGAQYSSLHQQYLSVILKFQVCLYERFQKLWFHNNLIYKFSNLKKKEEKLMLACTHLTKHLIERKREEMLNSKEKCTRKNQGTVKPFLELMLNISNERESFTDDQIRHETDTIIAAAHETSATVLNLALILLGSYPELQAKVYNEVLEVSGYSDKDLDKNDLTKLVYTKAVLKETLRLYAPVPVVARHIDKDIKIKNFTLRANAGCYLFFNGLNRNPAWGPDADLFRPERWFDPASLPDRKHFGSFALGKRNCIGKTYAMMSMKITLAHVIKRYRVTADINKVVFKWHMLSYPASGNHYTLHRRDTKVLS